MWAIPTSALLALLLAGTGPARAASTTVTEKNNPKFGTILADSASKTLYTLTNNGKPVACTGLCAQVWPPLTVPPGTKVTGPPGVCCLGSTTNADGDVVTYQGDPLYRYVNDSSPSDATGDGVVSFGGTWHVVRVASSAPVTTTTVPAMTTTVPAASTPTTAPAISTTTPPAATASGTPSNPAVGSGAATAASNSSTVAAAAPLGAPGTGGTPPRRSDLPWVLGLSGLVVALGLASGAVAISRSRGET